MSYYATYSMVDLLGVDGSFPVGDPRDEFEGECDTLFYAVRVFENPHEDPDPGKLVGTSRIRRVMISKIINERRSIFDSMDQIDQLQSEIFEAVWDRETDHYRDEDAMCGDLVIFEGLQLVDGAVLRDFDINKILDDVAYHVGGDDGLVVYLDQYADFVHFNMDACYKLEGIGFERPGTLAGLSVRRPRRTVSR